MMTGTVILILSAIILLLLGIIFFLWQKKPAEKNEALLLLQQQVNALNQTLDNRLSESARLIQTQSNQSAQIFSQVYEKLAQLDATNQQVVGHTEKILELESIFKNPKQKGIVGEFLLESLLKNILPPTQYLLQHNLGVDEATGKELIVDAVILVDKNKMIPIDAKFSADNYNRIVAEKDPQQREQFEKMFVQDLKNRIDETAKYVQPTKGTMDYALMFIPADRIYSDLLDNEIGGAIKSNTRSLIDYGHEKKVHVVSPTTFNVFLMTILQGLRAFEIGKFAQEIRQRMEFLRKHLNGYEEYLKKVGKNLDLTVSAYNSAYKEFGKIDKDVAKITGGEPQAEIKQLDGPLDE
jgi:DNA recombination protein RmuC